LLSCLIVTI